jgi:diguanylate cyclase (GGDEF)-like protein
MIELRRTMTGIESHGSEVSEILQRCVLGLGFFSIAMPVTVCALIWANRGRAAAAKSLQATNAAFEKALDLDRRKLAILEMVGRHAPLSQSLAAVAELAAAYRPDAGAAVWSTGANTLPCHASADLPGELAEALRSYSFGVPLADVAAVQEADLEHVSVPLTNSAGEPVGLLAIFFPRMTPGPPLPISSQMAQLASLAIENTFLYERLAFQAQHDILTGLPNRLLFQDRIQQAILLAQRNRRKLAVLWIDVDRFKQINDTLGHRVGDDLLCEVARRLKFSLRESDTTARIGGDEFVVLLAGIENGADATIVAEKMMQPLRVPVKLAGHELRISVSMGVGVFPEHGIESATLMRHADLAMYQAKRAGRDAIRSFLPQFGASQDRRLHLEQELKTAIEAGEFHLEYQPLITKRGQLSAFEALLRWTSPALGKVSPAEFVPIAEEAGEILRIGEWVLRTACRQGAIWIESGIAIPSISVNASAIQFADKSFTGMVRSALEESGFPPSKLEIEVTETALVNNIECALDHITGLRKLGIKFAIDDFGTGYSSLSQLRILPVDYVKVDRSFIKDLQDSPTDTTTLVRGIINLAHDLDLRVVAEGVESERQLSLLRSMGCDINQGFFLHRPMGPAAAEELMRRNGAGTAAVVAPAVFEEDLVGVVQVQLA